jgi:hypothetical protein
MPKVAVADEFPDDVSADASIEIAEAGALAGAKALM